MTDFKQVCSAFAVSHYQEKVARETWADGRSTKGDRRDDSRLFKRDRRDEYDSFTTLTMLPLQEKTYNEGREGKVDLRWWLECVGMSWGDRRSIQSLSCRPQRVGLELVPLRAWDLLHMSSEAARTELP